MLMTDQQVKDRRQNSALQSAVFLAGSGFVTGSRTLPSEEIDKAFGMPIGKLRSRAGIESVAYASEGESELTLGTQAANEALRATGCAAEEIDSIIATSETHHVYPSLAAQLHSSIGARESCGAFDVGGACLGLVNALAVAQSMIVSGNARSVVVVTADVHSRTLVPGRVAGEFGGLFGDGAVALVATGDHVIPAPDGPQVVASRSEVYPDTGEVLAWRLGTGGFRIVLTQGQLNDVKRFLNPVLLQQDWPLLRTAIDPKLRRWCERRFALAERGEPARKH